jgi:hypothetical protein
MIGPEQTQSTSKLHEMTQMPKIPFLALSPSLSQHAPAASWGPSKLSPGLQLVLHNKQAPPPKWTAAAI